MAYHVNTCLPNWQENKYYVQGFKGSSYYDYLFYIISKIDFFIYSMDKDYKTETPLDEKLKQYDKKIKVKKL